MRSLTSVVLLLFRTYATVSTPVPDAGNGTAALAKRVTHTGRGTWFNPGLGACGLVNGNNDDIVAIGIGRFGGGGNCNQWVHITNTANGKTAYGLTRDACPGCSMEDLDMSPHLFERLAPLSVGVIQIQWNFKAKGFEP